MFKPVQLKVVNLRIVAITDNPRHIKSSFLTLNSLVKSNVHHDAPPNALTLVSARLVNKRILAAPGCTWVISDNRASDYYSDSRLGPNNPGARTESGIITPGIVAFRSFHC